MALIQPIRATREPFLVACLATLALTLAACSSASPLASPSASVNSSTGAAPSASQAPTISQAPSASQPVTASPGAASQPETIHVLEPSTNVTMVSVGSLTGCTSTTGCQGDYVLGDDPLLDATTKQAVGRLLFECFRVDVGGSLFHCPGNTITLTGRGQIVYTEDVHFAPGYALDTWPITGATGEFLGATGSVSSPANSSYTGGGDFVITITK